MKGRNKEEVREVKINREPYDKGLKLYDKEEIELREGLTVLIGCNGSGKSTLLRMIQGSLEKEG